MSLNIINKNLHEVEKNIKLLKERKFLNLINNTAKIISSALRKGNKVLFCGNGGSAADAQHISAELLGKYLKNRNPYAAIDLTSNVAAITAISNDINYSKIFSYQAESLCKKGDLLIIISSSGNSKNVINLANWAKKNKVFSISFTGFDGGKLKKISNLNIHINIKNYGLVEDSHHILMHAIMHYIIKKNANKKKLRL